MVIKSGNSERMVVKEMSAALQAVDGCVHGGLVFVWCREAYVSIEVFLVQQECVCKQRFERS